MDTYQKNTQDYNSKPFTIGGGTFARSMKNSVAYGAILKDQNQIFINQRIHLH